jgi:multiple sugar transport system permease protein
VTRPRDASAFPSRSDQHGASGYQGVPVQRGAPNHQAGSRPGGNGYPGYRSAGVAIPAQRTPHRHAAPSAPDPFERREQTPRRRRRRYSSALIAWLFLLPALILFTYFKYLPLLQGAKMSFYNVRPYLGDQFVGFANYGAVTTDPKFTQAILQTLVLAVGTTVGSILVGFVLALLLEGHARHLWLIRTAAFIPVVTTMAVVAEVWRIMYYPSGGGLLNGILGVLGLGPQPFLVSQHQALGSVMVVGIWRGAPYDMIIFLAGLATVNRNLYEAAAVDGASRWRRFVHVTLPALRPVFSILAILAALRGLRSFTEVFLLTNGAPNGSTEVLMTLIYKLGLEQGKLGVAAAGSMVLFGATALLTIVVNTWRRRAAR